ncbi:MAG: tripartite tricarboxylate transporter substrate binding protein [Comamonadaceae bacterium]|nr:MAG: tripartite tricarboxylate transporter substrate binding protein [Comamonadaceae bacterium]
MTSNPPCSLSVSRRSVLRGAAVLAAAPVLPVVAQSAPDILSGTARLVKPLTIVVPFPPGGRSGWLAGRMAVGLDKVLGETVTVEHRIGPVMKEMTAFAASEPDGRTLLLAMVRLPRRGVFSSDAENRMVESLVPVTVVARDPMVLVMSEKRAAELGIANVADLLRHARENPGKLTMASGVDGSTSELASELFKTRSRTYITRVPAAGLTPDAEAVIGGRIDLLFATLHAARESLRSHELRALAVTSGSQFPPPGLDRLGAKEAVPLLQSQPPFAGFEIYDYSALYAPAGTPAAIADSLQQAAAKVLTQTPLRELLLNNNAVPGGITRAEFAQLERDEERRWRQARGRW